MGPWLAAFAVAASTSPAAPERAAERLRMASEQLEERGVADARVLKAMREVPRHLFVPAGEAAHAYEDRPLPIGFGQTISQPYIVAVMSELLALEPGMKVLEVGTGSGYQAAVLAAMGMDVYSMELVPQLAAEAGAALRRSGYRVRARVGDGYEGWAEHAPYDAVIVTCAAAHVPPPLLRQLKDGGRLAIPVGSAWRTQDLLLVTKEKGKARSRSVMPVRFVPLVRP